MDTNAFRSAFDRDGFVVIRNFLPDDELIELSENIERYIRYVVPTLPDEDAFYEDKCRPETLKQLHRMSRDPYFEAYRSSSRWTEFAAAMLGEACKFREPEWFNKPPDTEHATPPHQDNFYFCLDRPSVLTMWLALDKVDEENGCLRYLAGSHRCGLRPHQRTQTLGFSQGILDYGSPERAQETAVLLQPGDMVCHHGETIHRAERNRSSVRTRRAFAMVAEGASAVVDPVALARYEEQYRAQQNANG